MTRSGRRISGPRHSWAREQIKAKFQEWAERFKETPRRSDWDTAYMRKLADGHMALAEEWLGRVAIYESEDWPSSRHVSNVFGSWNLGVKHAGLIPRRPGQHTKRGATPSPFLVPLGAAFRAAHEAMGLRDPVRLASTLREVARVANRLAREAEQSA